MPGVVESTDLRAAYIVELEPHSKKKWQSLFGISGKGQSMTIYVVNMTLKADHWALYRCFVKTDSGAIIQSSMTAAKLLMEGPSFLVQSASHISSWTERASDYEQ